VYFGWELALFGRYSKATTEPSKRPAITPSAVASKLALPEMLSPSIPTTKEA